jgi:hypothetical protein
MRAARYPSQRTEDDFRKLQRPWSLIRERGAGRIYLLPGSSGWDDKQPCYVTIG